MDSCNKFKLFSGVIILSVVSLTSCASWREQPPVNPHPKYYLTLKGHIAKELHGKVQLRFIQGVAGLSDKCTHITNHLEGISGNPIKYYPYLATPDSQGNYEIKIPLDGYLPGYCDWQPWTLGIALTNEEYHYQSIGLAFVKYSNKKSDTKSARVIKYVCPEQVNNPETGDNCDSFIGPGKEDPNYVKTDRSTAITLNITYQGKKDAHRS